MIIIKIWVVVVLILMVAMYTIMKVSNHLGNKPKKHKFRKWWSSHVCDLDNLYN